MVAVAAVAEKVVATTPLVVVLSSTSSGAVVTAANLGATAGPTRGNLGTMFAAIVITPGQQLTLAAIKPA
ncbi:hypothetical protein DFJ73DRAFT_783690 [Zopfochytrium polystomum]|nr:hypothetical protein DFJ73DRAFT_783690 [Zopfochytrium polystomum]